MLNRPENMDIVATEQIHRNFIFFVSIFLSPVTMSSFFWPENGHWIVLPFGEIQMKMKKYTVFWDTEKKRKIHFSQSLSIRKRPKMRSTRQEIQRFFFCVCDENTSNMSDHKLKYHFSCQPFSMIPIPLNSIEIHFIQIDQFNTQTNWVIPISSYRFEIVGPKLCAPIN